MNKLKQNQFKFKNKIYNRLTLKQRFDIFNKMNEPVINHVNTFLFFKKKIITMPTNEEKKFRVVKIIEKMYPEINNFSSTELDKFLTELTK